MRVRNAMRMRYAMTWLLRFWGAVFRPRDSHCNPLWDLTRSGV